MKYMVPEINISKFSAENIVTLSGTGKASDAITEALASVEGVSNTATYKTTMNDWVSAN